MGSVFCLLLFAGPELMAQDEVTRAIVLEQPVEFSTTVGEEAADFQTVSIKLRGKLLKQFAAPRGGFLTVVATFNGHDGDYLLLRTSMGQGACAGGDLYALKFYTFGERRKDQIGIEVSPVLTTCLGEWPPVKFTYSDKGILIINVSGYELRGEAWSRWVPERKPKNPNKKR